MALPNSGALSLNQIHVEAGGSSGSTASINDSDIRALISKSSGAQMSFNEWYGASSQQVVSFTISSAAWGKSPETGYDAPGATNPAGQGSISNNLLPTLNNATSWNVSPTFRIVNVSTQAGFYTMRCMFGSAQNANSGVNFSQLLGMTINGTFFSRLGGTNFAVNALYTGYGCLTNATFNGNNTQIPNNSTVSISLHFI